MPNISIYVSDDVDEYLQEKIGKGNVSPYVQALILKDKGRIVYEEDKKFVQGILDFGLFFVGLAFILLVVSTNFFPGIGPFGYVIVLLTGGVLLTMQSVLKIFSRRKRNGISNTDIV